MNISIVVLAQHAKQLESCLAAIGKHTKRPYELIVVNDGGLPEINGLLSQPGAPVCRIVALEQREGVAAGYNRGFAAAAGDRIAFIRDHIQVSEGWLDALSDCMDAHPEAALVGPMTHGVSGIQNASEVPSEAMLAVDRAMRPLLLGKQQSAMPVARLLNILLLADKEAFRQLGGFDERFVLETYEDDDLCYRALLAGFGLYVALDCFVRYSPPLPLFPEDPGRLARQLEANRRTAMEKWGEDVTAALSNWKRDITVSLCMIVKNEEQTLARCLSSVCDLVDEIVILDTGSTDRTKAIARQFDAAIYDFVWEDDFAKARNRAFELATQEYILWLDADDILLPEDRLKFRTLVSALPWQTDAVSMTYNLARDEYGNVTASLRRNRLVRRSCGFRWVGIVHEYLDVYGKFLHSDVCVTHDRQHTNSSRNLQIYERRFAAGELFTPRDQFYFANELFEHGQWERAAEQYECFLAGNEGWVEDKISACGRAAECYRELKDMLRAKQKALQSFSYALPRAENCCRLGMFYLSEGNYADAVWWYKLAAGLTPPADSHAILQHVCWTWLPHLQLCVCYDRLGQYELAYGHNEQAAAFIPDDTRVKGNREYLLTRLST
ncbi:glycosyltransferase [Paenibacillus contaminans]|uniref:Glycosyltransferase 2-like domain-containing protein n=1 Tax=Paenibacillus contaminans TaxID=450362 RepID=A0A329M5S9_9BACL|nr:glycosyltransferase [Paenibacillus contaminans]RAV15294.1 hypothetical protein DQG23_30285 [Paenibacillus contaminans]